ESLTEHAMASSAAASTRREEATHSTADMLARTWKEALQRHRVADVLKCTKLEKMAKDLGFWAYRLDDAFPADMHNRLVTLMNESFDPTKCIISERKCRQNTARI
ncbi:MAG: hypothetical protein ACKPKO_23025, partial [Candidatus Fonsibacter sp.]